MYRLLLVDDEPDVLEYFGNIFKENVGSRMDIDVYTVDSAEEALEYFREFKVDIVVTDIQMPGMNGIELYQELKSAWPKLRLIFLTGYMDFEYAYTAAQDGKTRFLMKLESVEKIVATVSEVIGEMEQDYREKELLQQALEQSRQAVPLLQNKALGQFLYGKTGTFQAAQNFEKLGISINLKKDIFILGIDLDQKQEDVDQEHFGFIQRTLMMSCFEGQYRLWNYLPENQTTPYIWILQQSRMNVQKLPEILECVQKKLQKNTDNTISCSYANVLPPYEDMQRLLRRMQSTLGYRDMGITENILPCELQGEKESIVQISDMLKESWQQMNQIAELERTLETGQEQIFFQYLERAAAPLREIQSMNNPLALEIYCQIAVLLQRYINLWGLYEKMAFQIETYRLLRIHVHDSWADAVDFLFRVSHLIFELYFEKERDGINNYIVSVKNYIWKNLDKELTLLILAETVHLNASYLSRLFRKITGEKLYDYILEIRMDRAKELILKGSLKIQEVAQCVGYESVQSFNRAFKKYTGMAPVDYRNGTSSQK